jgi:uncharacterized membrane protein YphA (DoxX/SURF4 family)
MKKFMVHPYLTVFSRAALGGILMFSGIAKISYTDTLIREINQYHILSGWLAELFGRVLPPLEIVLGAFLILGIWLRVSAAIGGLLCLSFTIAKVSAYARGLDIAVCNCFGPAVPLLSSYTLAIDIVLLLLAVQIIFHRQEFLSIDALLLKKTGTAERSNSR